jgi:hypothetical protein
MNYYNYSSKRRDILPLPVMNFSEDDYKSTQTEAKRLRAATNRDVMKPSRSPALTLNEQNILPLPQMDFSS